MKSFQTPVLTACILRLLDYFFQFTVFLYYFFFYMKQVLKYEQLKWCLIFYEHPLVPIQKYPGGTIPGWLATVTHSATKYLRSLVTIISANYQQFAMSMIHEIFIGIKNLLFLFFSRKISMFLVRSNDADMYIFQS